MTDNDIIKALECCSHSEGHKCSICPYKDENNIYCVEFLLRDSLALINSQKAERLNGWVKTEDEVRAIAKQTIQSYIDIIKAEAIKEFAERLKSMCDKPYWCVWLSEIEDLEEEMIGEQEDEK